MKRVDQMISYLSGEMTREDAEAFLKEMSDDHRLRETFDRVSYAYELIGDQLRKRDEEAFHSALSEAMSGQEPDRNPWRRRRLLFLIFPIAATAAILLAIFLLRDLPEDTYHAYYAPSEDPVLKGILQETRGSAAPAALLYRQGAYKQAFSFTSDLVLRDTADHLVLLIHLLSALELDREQEVFPMLEVEGDSHTTTLKPLTWYHALALIKTGAVQEAIPLLETLSGQPGPYSEPAHKLLRKLIK